jgi:hypothetical protein
MDESQLRETEKQYLGALLEAAGRGEVDTTLSADDFTVPHYKKLFPLILKQHREGTEPTIITLANELPENPDLTAGITNSYAYANIKYYENIILEASKKRIFVTRLKLALEDVDKGTAPDTVIKNLLPALEAVTNAKNDSKIKTSTILLSTEYPPIKWVVPDLIGEGLTMLCGAPKIGKSWFVLGLSIAAAAGGRFLGSIQTMKTETLYLALEDTDRRIHNRLKKLGASPDDNLKITTQWHDGYFGLETYLKEHKETGLVIVDTLARFANIEDMNDYSMTTAAMARLKRIADDLEIAIVVIHHAKKTGNGKDNNMDWTEKALGSTGLTGATDSTILIDRDRGKETKNTAALYATGRDTGDIYRSLKLDLDCGGWTIIGKSAPEPSGASSSPGKGFVLSRETAEQLDPSQVAL